LNNYLELPAIKVVQPLGVFYSVMVPADILGKITFVARAQYKTEGIFNKVLSPIKGTQRESSEKREKEIAAYIDSSESALPNAIIIGANIKLNGKLAEENDRWYVQESREGCYKLIVPKEQKLASIIDGQHRLNGCLCAEHNNYNLICSVYLDLPAPYHAYLFATINANQKKVERSLAYELYGFSLDIEPRNIWSPEKLGVYLVRKLNSMEGSPLFHKVLLGAQQEDENKDGIVSLASLVDSILSLISPNPKLDRDNILHYRNINGRGCLVLKSSSPPLRYKYIEGDDSYIEDMIISFLKIVDKYLLLNQPAKSYIKKTVGYQALFDFLKYYLRINNGEFDSDNFTRLIQKISRIDFTDNFYTASGLGRSRMKNVMLVNSGLKSIDSLQVSSDYLLYKERVLG
jgi:DNA phosphorothioation-associated DGQHR protein 1